MTEDHRNLIKQATRILVSSFEAGTSSLVMEQEHESAKYKICNQLSPYFHGGRESFFIPSNELQI